MKNEKYDRIDVLSYFFAQMKRAIFDKSFCNITIFVLFTKKNSGIMILT